MTILDKIDAAMIDVGQAVLDTLAIGTEHQLGELARLERLMQDYPRRGGKALRARLVLLSAAAHGADPREAVPVAAALETFQNWVLVHDDIEDDSDTRRGSPALHRLVGVPVALNVGDAMHVAMWRSLIAIQAPWRDAVLDEFLDVIGTTAEGQHLDLAWIAEGRFDVGQEDYLDMVERKTAAYTVVGPLRLGAIVAGRAPAPEFTSAGKALGSAFQIRDDVLNLLPDEEGKYGKEFAGDLYEGKRTLVLAHAFERLSPTQADRLRTLLGRSRADKTEADVHEALAILNVAGSIDHAQLHAERTARDALATLRTTLDREAQDGGAASLLLATLEHLVARNH